MALPVTWTENAIEDFKSLIDYLLLEWPLPVAEKFIETIEKRIEVLSKFPNIGIASLKRSFHKKHYSYEAQQALL